MALATQEAIRDRIIAVVEATTPASLTDDKFRRYRNELGADFEEWAPAHVTACLRRFQVREIDDEEPPPVSHLTVETVRVRFAFRMAYPQSHRYGADNALDRDDAMNADWKKIKYAITGTGGNARANFTSATDGQYDCTPLPHLSKTLERGNGVDYLVATLLFEYQRATA